MHICGKKQKIFPAIMYSKSFPDVNRRHFEIPCCNIGSFNTFQLFSASERFRFVNLECSTGHIMHQIG